MAPDSEPDCEPVPRVHRRVFSVKEIAQILGCCEWTVYRLLDEKRLKGFRLFRVWRITEQALIDFQNR